MKKTIIILFVMLFTAGMVYGAQYDYNPSDSPGPYEYDSDTYTELGWTDINVTQSDNVTDVVIDYTWGTDSYAYEGSFHLESPSGTAVEIASGESDGTYSHTLTDFDGEAMNGTWKLWIQDSFGDGGHQATGITVEFHYVQAGAPGYPTNPSPAEGATGVAVDGTLTWDFGSDTETYDLWFGEAGSMSEVVTGSSAGATGSYSYSGLSNSTEYEWQVIAHNSNKRITTDGPVWSFTTKAQTITTFPYEEDFDGTWSGTPAAPIGWTVVNADDDSYTWTQDDTYITPHSGDWTAHGMGNQDDYLITPPLDLTGKLNARIKWWDVVESASYNNTYKVLVSTTTNDITAFTDSLGNYDCTNTTWTEHVLDLSTYSGETIYVAFYQYYSAATYYGFGIDDVTIEETPTTPVFAIDPDSVGFGTQNINTTSDTTYFTISNDGGGTLTITSTSITGSNPTEFTLCDTNTYNVELGAGEEMYVGVAFAPTTEGDKTAALEVQTTEKATYTTNLTGTGFDPYITSFPYTQNFDGVTAPALPPDWSKLDDTGSSWTDVETIASNAHSDPNSVKLYNSSETTGNLILISPPTQLSTVDTRIKFWAKGSSGYQIDVGTMTDPTDPATFSSLEVVDITGTYTEYTVNVTSKTKDDAYIGLKHGMSNTYRTIYIDDFTWEETPTTPVFAMDPDSAGFGQVEVGTASTDTTTFTISNDGGGTLSISSVSLAGTDSDQFGLIDTNSYSVDLGAGEEMYVDVYFSPTSIGAKTAELSVEANAKVTHTAALTGVGFNPNYGGGGTGQGGYYFANSLPDAAGAPSQPTYNWIDISASGTDVSGDVAADSDVGGPYDIGFTFNYFGTDYTQFYICADGYISLVEETSSDYTNDPIPDTDDPNGMIALLWDDMNPADPDVTDYHLYYGNLGGNLVITYEKMPEYNADADGWFTAQAILFPTGNIKMQYKSVGSSFDLSSCTVGIENAAGDAGVQYLYNGTGGEIYAGTKAGEVAVMFGDDAGTLPVELIAGSLTAQFATDNNYNFVKLAWATASETDLQGFNVYRGNTSNQYEAAKVNADLIPGVGNSTEIQEYSFEDITADVYTESYYWLEMVDLDGSNYFHGPVTYSPEEQEIPEDVQTTVLRNCQPNPVRNNVKIAYQLKGSPSEQNAELRVYNIQGRLVKTVDSDNGIFEFSVSDFSSGIYFYQLKTESFNQIKKMVVVK
ncbi:MAG: choice-of-anchor J domain-containing protein [Candidatus Cloacimonetes bacterium]|nr:choice-of-anchor J domain-containing protein [Candidatus Cloacimonadota bacterium]